MNRHAVLGPAIIAGVLAFASTADAAAYKVFVHGRNQTQYRADAVVGTTGYTNAFVNYNATTATLAQANQTVRSRLATFCSNGNTCIIVAYSNGGLQVGYTQANYPEALSGALFIEAGGDAAGGSDLLAGWKGNLGEVFGQTYYDGVDATLTPSGARNAYNHNLTAGILTYHLGGETDWNNSSWYYKTSGFLPGPDDGVVSFHSAFACVSTGSQGAGCTKWTGHRNEGDSTCSSRGVCGTDHFSIDRRAAIWAK